MRLDTVGKPPLVQNDNFEKVKIDNVQVQGVKEINPSEMDTNSSGAQARPRLGKVLNILKKAEDDHKKKKKDHQASSRSVALQIYQRMGSIEQASEQSGQTLNVKV